MTTADEMRAAIRAASEAPRKRKGSKGRLPRQTLTVDATYRLAFEIAKRALEYGGNRGDQARAIREVMRLEKLPAHRRAKAIWGAKQALRRRQDAVANAEAVKLVADMNANLKELERRIANVPQDRRGPLMRMAMVDLLNMLRAHSIDGNFPLEWLEWLEDLKPG